ERLRIWHPALAVLSALYIFGMLGFLAEGNQPPITRRFARMVQLLVAGQIAAGVVNLVLLAPVFMQLIHLLLADIVWISLVLYAATKLEKVEEVAVQERVAATA